MAFTRLSIEHNCIGKYFADFPQDAEKFFEFLYVADRNLPPAVREMNRLADLAKADLRLAGKFKNYALIDFAFAKMAALNEQATLVNNRIATAAGIYGIKGVLIDRADPGVGDSAEFTQFHSQIDQRVAAFFLDDIEDVVERNEALTVFHQEMRNRRPVLRELFNHLLERIAFKTLDQRASTTFFIQTAYFDFASGDFGHFRPFRIRFFAE